jgi:hypothetical protein
VDGSECFVRAIGFAYNFAIRHNAELTAILANTEQPPAGATAVWRPP